MSKKHFWIDKLWDAWCIISIIGIWPRFIEPRWLKTSNITLPIQQLPPALSGLKILHLSDLHWNEHFSKTLLKQLLIASKRLNPDIIVMTGDFISRSQMEDPAGLSHLLNSFCAPYGCYAVFGNHDYNEFLTMNRSGEYDISHTPQSSPILQGFKRLFGASVNPSGTRTAATFQVQPQEELQRILSDSPFKILNNETIQLQIKGHSLNLCGIAEYMSGHFNPPLAFAKYDKNLPGILLVHNPDAAAHLENYPGDLILSGHTHGGQINLFGLWKLLMKCEHPEWKKGLKQLKNKKMSISAGLGAVMKFRWFSRPEITLINLKAV